MKVLICGSRDLTDKFWLFAVLDDIIKENKLEITEIIEGAANGIDKNSGEYAKINNIKLIEVPADWEDFSEPCVIGINKFGKRYNKLAGHNRNLKMLNLNPDLVIAIHNNSTGTKHTIENAKKRKIRVIEKIVK